MCSVGWRGFVFGLFNPVHFFPRMLGSADLLVHYCQGVVWLRILGLKFDRLFERQHRFLEFSFLLQDLSHLVVGMSQAGFISQSLSQLSLGFRQAIQRCQRYSEVQMWPWGWMLLHAIELDGLVIVQNGFPRLPEIVVAKAEIFIRPHHPRIKRNDLMEFGDRLRVVLGVIIQSSEPIDIAGVLWGTT